MSAELLSSSLDDALFIFGEDKNVMIQTNTEKTLERRYTEKETAALLGVSKMTIRRKREAGELRFYKIGARIIISEGQIVEFLERTEQNKSGRDGDAP